MRSSRPAVRTRIAYCESVQVELPDVREAIIAHDALDQPAIIVMDGNGIGRAPTRTSGRGDGGTFCPANLWQARPPTISRSAVSVKAYSASTTAWCASRMRCRGGR